MKKLLIAIPALNESGTLGRVITDAVLAVEHSLSLTPDVLVVDDGSTDDTSQVAQSLGAKVIRHEYNQGLGVAFRDAVDYAIMDRYDVLLTIDADGQFAAEDIPRLIEPIRHGVADLVTGSRFLPDSTLNGIPRAKKFGNKLVTRLINSITKEHFSDVSCGFRAYSREALLHLHLFGSFTYTHEVLLNLSTKGLRIVEVPVTVIYSATRTSRIASDLLRYGWRTGKIIFKSTISYQPSRLFGTVAIVLLIAATPVLVVLGIRYLLTDLITPFKGIGITALIMLVLSFTSFVAGTVLEVSRRSQLTLEEILYYEKSRHD